MNQDKKIQVVMLATNRSELCIMVNHNEYKIGTDEENLFLQYSKDFSYGSSITDNSQSPQHLYFLSDDEIKEGDFRFENGHIYHTPDYLTANWANKNGCKKIVLSTDKSLELPEPSQEWIKYFVSQFNNGNIITEVMVEYILGEDYLAGTVGNNEIWSSYPDIIKVNPDNTTNIKPVEETWDDINYEYENFRYIHPQISFIEWLKENYQVLKR